MIYAAKGRGNCEKCGRFAWLVDIDPPRSGYSEQWGAWCKKHAPKWAIEQHKRNLVEEGKEGPTPEIETQSAGGSTEGTSCAANVQRSSP